MELAPRAEAGNNVIYIYIYIALAKAPFGIARKSLSNKIKSSHIFEKTFHNLSTDIVYIMNQSYNHCQ